MGEISVTTKAVFNSLSWVDKLLPVWIIGAIVIGIVLSVYVPDSREAFNGAKVINVSVPLAIGMVVMMVPPLCKIQWENGKQLLFRKNRINKIIISLVLNWIVCPFIMFGLAWLTLFDQPEYRVGVIMIGLARCIAMVLLWNDIALGDNELCAILVIINSLMQLVLFAPYKILFCDIMGGGRSLNNGASTTETYTLVSQTIAFFLGIPIAIGLLIRFVSLAMFGKKVYNEKILPLISPFGLLGLLYTIIVLFIDKGNSFIQEIGTAFRCFIPLICYFIISWFSVFFVLRWFYGRNYIKLATSDELDDGNFCQSACGCEKNSQRFTINIVENVPARWNQRFCSAPYPEIATQAFTAGSNNFELSLAVAIAIYGNGSKQAVAATFGPLVEVPVLLLITFVSRYLEISLLWSDREDTTQALLDNDLPETVSLNSEMSNNN
ncbi:hypothetical protein CANARDRAFT_204823 [[Candida] arabinofermentans NRRL YB-2248]|uniref:Arsenical-resistance protein n=1 Tax=[Candida] arabinofermentans NRRL YB-2248 TaxID=983967 RepID=A0A1E4ST13_9ASCO|nr:hypothetical protein CANARDRAFT_204823 [[Candida] arabinofermentans NRRL YB-2248]